MVAMSSTLQGYLYIPVKKSALKQQNESDCSTDATGIRKLKGQVPLSTNLKFSRKTIQVCYDLTDCAMPTTNLQTKPDSELKKAFLL
jgi:hypothetical protein